MRITTLVFAAVLQITGGSVAAKESLGLSSQGGTSFEGAYIGLGFGAAMSDGMMDTPVLSGGTDYISFDPGTGQGFGVAGGYNFQRKNWVYGPDLRLINLLSMSDGNSSKVEANDLKEAIDLRGRVGYVRGDLMFYGAIGWSWVKLHVHPGLGFYPRENETTLDGISLGLGLEYNLNERWSVGAEYTYRNVEGQFKEATQKTDIDLNTLWLQLNYRF